MLPRGPIYYVRGASHDFVDMSLDIHLAKIDEETAIVHKWWQKRLENRPAGCGGGARRDVKLARITRGRYTTLHEDGPSTPKSVLLAARTTARTCISA